MKPDILLVEDPATVLPILPLLERHFTVHHLPYGGDRDGVLARVGGRIRALVTTTLAGADARLINALPRLEMIAIAGGHVDRTDLALAGARGIAVSNAPGVSSEDVADLVIALLLATARRLATAERFVRGRRWPGGVMPFGTKVTGKTLGIVGLGSIGREVASRARGFRLEVCYHEPRPQADVPYRYYPNLEEMAAAADFLAVTCTSGPSTRHLIGRPVLAALGPRGILVTVARGVVDEAALLEALRDHAIAGAGLDVFENEPAVPAELFAMEEVVLTPHIGWDTRETRQALADLTVANVRAHFAGQPLLTPVR